MTIKSVCQQFNVFAQCRKHNLPFWQCPQFLFLITGAIIIIVSLITYALGVRYITDPNLVSLIVIGITVALFIMNYIIIHGFEKLAEANRLKSEFISIVSHQLRSPLSNLKWAVELLFSKKIGQISEKQEDYLKILSENTIRMGELISSLLTVSRIEQGRLILNKSDFSIKNLVSEVISKFEPQARASGIEIKFSFPNSLPNVFTDPTQVKLAVEIFLDNAVRYIKGKGEVLVILEGRRKDLLLKVQDNGVGIPEEDKKHIFEKFFRSRNVLKYQTEGSGIGLYIAKSVIEECGGRIGFQSKENKGSTFWFTLPIKNS